MHLAAQLKLLGSGTVLAAGQYLRCILHRSKEISNAIAKVLI